MNAAETARAILDLYDGRPERWCQHSNALDNLGAPTSQNSEYATSCCIMGACYLVLGPMRTTDVYPFRDAFGCEVEQFNDHPKRTFAEVVAKLEVIANG